MAEYHSALAAYLDQPATTVRDGTRRLRLAERRGWQLALLTGFAGQDRAFADSLAPHLGGVANPDSRFALETPRGRLFHVAARQFWVVTPAADLLAMLAAALPPTVGSLTLLSDSRVRVAISGKDAPRVLAKGIAVDLDPAVFTVGQFAQTALHHTGVLLHRAGAELYELYLPRSFAATLWEWLTDAAAPLGYEILRPTDPAHARADAFPGE